MFRHLTIEMILQWADAYREAMGRWPNTESGHVAGTVCESWKGIDRALREGRLGLPGGTTLAQLLVEHRGARFSPFSPPLTEEQILAWADEYHKRTGQWPTVRSREVPEAPFERWSTLDSALRQGRRTLPGGLSLSQLLARRRGVRNLQDLPDLTEEQILAWADAFHSQKGTWPSRQSGLIPDSGGETWHAVDTALRVAQRGLPGGSSLPRLVAEKRGVRKLKDLPPLSEAAILAWADAHFQRTGGWPNVRSGPVVDAPGETWDRVDAALIRAIRQLPRTTSLARLLATERGVRISVGVPRLKLRQVLAWADAHFQRHGSWPNAHSGPIPEAPGETWTGIEMALRNGRRGFRQCGSSLARCLAEHRGKRNTQGLPPLAKKRIVAWAEAHHERTGQWPTQTSGPIPEAPGETWMNVDVALRRGLRGLPPGNSLIRLLARKRGVRNSSSLPPLTPEQIVSWALSHKERTGAWPTRKSGDIPDTGGESWVRVDSALRNGGRGLPSGSSLARLLGERCGKRNLSRPPALSLEDVWGWAEAHRQRAGCLPTNASGPIVDAPGETWMAVDCALSRGGRGLPGGSSLAKFLRQREDAAAGSTEQRHAGPAPVS